MANRHLSIPIDVLAAVDEIPVARSKVIGTALLRAREDPGRLIRALEKRVSSNTAESQCPQTKAVSLSLPTQVLQALGELNALLQIGTEHVVRLALEAYLSKQG